MREVLYGRNSVRGSNNVPTSKSISRMRGCSSLARSVGVIPSEERTSSGSLKSERNLRKMLLMAG